MSSTWRDELGGVSTTDRPEVAAAWEATVAGLAAHRGDTAQRLARVLELDPELCVALCLRGFALRMLARRELIGQARESLAAAKASLEARGGTEREHHLVRALAASCAGDSARAADELTAI